MRAHRLRYCYAFTGLILALTLGACPDKKPAGPDTDGHVFPSDGSVDPPFTVTQLLPDHGPVYGGTEVTVRGFGFDEGTRVYFGELMVDPQLTIFLGPNRILVAKTPPGVVGPVDIGVLRSDGESALFENGFTYDRLSVDPPSGSTAGGTFVRVRGAETAFTDQSIVFIGEEPLNDQQFVSANLITGYTTAHAPGLVTVEVQDASENISVPEAFSFYDSADPINGGLGGGPIQGEVNVTVLDTYSSEPVADAYVLMGANASSPYQAVTDASGRVTFSAPGLVGPQMLNVAAADYERVSVVAFDARDVTLFLTPFVPPTPGTIPGQSYSAVQGFVTFGGVEFGQGCDFSQMVPEPGPGERRIIKVYQSVQDYDYVATEPGESGIIVEGVPCTSAYEYFIYARPGSYAVYAMAGIENETTRVFTPWAMGITRGLISGPDQIIDADITVEFGLSRQVSFDISTAPPLDPPTGPIGYKLRVFVDIGGDGYIVRGDTQRTVTDASDLVVIDRLPELSNALAGANYSAQLEAHTNGLYPYSKVYLPVLPAGPSDIVVDQWLGIPQAVDPAPSGVPTTSRMIWDATGVEPTFSVVLIKTHPDGDAYWRLYLHGSVKQFVLPDLFGLGPGLDGHPSGEMFWHVIPIYVDGMDFNNFSYRYLNDRYWGATAGNGWPFTFPDIQ